MKKTNRWIQGARRKKTKGALHRQLGVSPGRKLPMGELKEIRDARVGTKVRGHKVTLLLKRRAMFALNAQKRRR